MENPNKNKEVSKCCRAEPKQNMDWFRLSHAPRYLCSRCGLAFVPSPLIPKSECKLCTPCVEAFCECSCHLPKSEEKKEPKYQCKSCRKLFPKAKIIEDALYFYCHDCYPAPSEVKPSGCERCEHGTFPCFSSGICKVKPNNGEEWEIEFDKIPQPDKIQQHRDFGDRDMIDFCQDIIKPFIRQTLSHSKTLILEKIEGMKKPISRVQKELHAKGIKGELESEIMKPQYAHNKTIDDIIKVIKEGK